MNTAAIPNVETATDGAIRIPADHPAWSRIGTLYLSPSERVSQQQERSMRTNELPDSFKKALDQRHTSEESEGSPLESAEWSSVILVLSLIVAFGTVVLSVYVALVK